MMKVGKMIIGDLDLDRAERDPLYLERVRRSLFAKNLEVDLRNRPFPYDWSRGIFAFEKEANHKEISELSAEQNSL